MNQQSGTRGQSWATGTLLEETIINIHFLLTAISISGRLTESLLSQDSAALGNKADGGMDGDIPLSSYWSVR